MAFLKKTKGNLLYADIIYLLAFSSYLINIFLNHTMFSQLSVIVIVKVVLFSIVIGGLVFKIIFIDQFKFIELILYILILSILSFISIKSGNRQLITLIALILGAKNVNFRYVLLSYLVIIVSLLILTFLSSLADIIPNLQYSRIREGAIKIRNSFGTIYPTVFAAYLQAIVVAFSYYINDKKLCNNILLLLLAVLNSYICLEYADARMGAYSITLYIIIFYFCKVFFRNIANQRFLSTLIIFCYPLCFFIIFYISHNYGTNEIFELINKLLSGRLKLGHSALQDYGIPLLGQEVKFIGLGGSVQEMSDDYNYVDSSYLQFLIKYGILFSIISVIAMIKLTANRLRLNDYRFVAIIAIISINSMIEDRLLDISTNIYWVMMLAYYNTRKDNV